MWSFIWSSCLVLVHLSISCASLSWMEVNFLNQNPYIPPYPGVFQFDIFFSVFLSSSMCISALGPSSSPSSSLVISFIHSAFSLCFFGCHIFVQNCSVSLASGCWYVFVSCPPHNIAILLIGIYIQVTDSLVECSKMVRETGVQSQVESYDLKMVLDTSLLNTQHYKVRIKGKVEQSRERSCALPYTTVFFVILRYKLIT